MAPSPQCSALAAAMNRTGYSYAQIAASTGTAEQRIIDICTGGAQPTDAEFNSLASALGIANVPHTGVHSTG